MSVGRMCLKDDLRELSRDEAEEEHSSASVRVRVEPGPTQTMQKTMAGLSQQGRLQKCQYPFPGTNNHLHEVSLGARARSSKEWEAQHLQTQSS